MAVFKRNVPAWSKVRRFFPISRKFRVLLALTAFVHLLNVASFTTRADLHRMVPRLVRELQRNSVSWDKLLSEARTRPRFSSSFPASVFVISLKQSSRRRKPLTDVLERNGVPHEIVFATDGRLPFRDVDLKYAGEKKLRKMGNTQVKYSVSTSQHQASDYILHERLRFGCYLSHVHLWEDLVLSKKPYYVVLEDDIRLETNNFAKVLAKELEKLPADWDLFYLNSCQTRKGGILRPGILQLKGALCTYGYAISMGGAAKLLMDTALRSEKPVDHMLDESIYKLVVSAYQADPPMIGVRPEQSTLQYPV